MNEYRILISHVSKDKDIALKLVEKFQGCEMTVGGETIRLKLIYMESNEDGCFGDFREWSERAVKNCDGVLAIITNNTAENYVLDDGVTINYKIVYDEISLAKSCTKDIMLLKDSGCDILADGYEILLQNISSVFFGGETDEKVVDELKQSIFLHARRRLAGDPLLEYAGKINVKLQPAVIGNTEDFLGREKELKEIEELYASGKNIVCLWGYGGIGKTTLAKMYAHAHPEEDVSICYCNAEESSLKNTIVSLGVVNDSPEFGKMNIDEKYDLRVKQLRQLGKQTLIIIDNFNADFGLNENKKVLSDMASIETCQFLISSRNGTLKRGDVATYNVGSMSPQELIDLFYRDAGCEHNQANDDSINNLIKITDGHTMTIELCAKAVGVDENGISVQDIVESFLSSEAVTRLEDSAREDGYDEYDTIYNHLRQLFALTKITIEQKKILGALSWVCQYGLTSQELKDTIGCDTKALIDLGRLGYVHKTDSKPICYFLHPLMSELSFKDFVTDAEEYRKVIDLVVSDKSKKTSEDTAYTLEARLVYGIHIANRLEKTCKLNTSFRRKWAAVCCNVGDVCMAIGIFTTAEDYYKQCYEISKAIAEETETIDARRGLAISYERLGDIHVAKGDIVRAEEYYNQDYEISKTLAEETRTIVARRGLAVSCDRLGKIFHANGDIKRAEEYYMQGYEISKAIAEETETIETMRDLSISCNKLGDISVAKGDIERAEEYYMQYYEISKALAEETGAIEARKGFAISCERLGYICEAKGNIDTADEYYMQVYEIFKAIAEKTGTIQARRSVALSCGRLGKISQAKGDIKTAEEYYMQYYEISKTLAEETGTIQARRGLAISYERLGDIHVAKGDIVRAEEYYNQDYEISKTLAEETGTIEVRRGLMRSCSRLGDISQAKGDIETAEEYYTQSYKISKAIAKETGTIDARRDLAISCSRLGDISKAKGDIESTKEYYMQDYEISKAIAEETGTILARRDLAISCEKLANIYKIKGNIENAKGYYLKAYIITKHIAKLKKILSSYDDYFDICNDLYSIDYVINWDKEDLDILLNAMNMVENLYEKEHINEINRYSTTVKLLHDCYKALGDEDGCRRMQEIIDMLEKDSQD